MVYLWNDTGLAQELKARTTSENSKFFYLVCFLVFHSLAFYIPEFGNDTVYMVKSIIGIILFVIWLVMLWKFYVINSMGDNVKFIERFVVLSIPVTLRTLPVLFGGFIVVIIWAIITSMMGIPDNTPTKGIGLMLIVLMTVISIIIYFYRRMARAMRIVSRQLEIPETANG